MRARTTLGIVFALSLVAGGCSGSSHFPPDSWYAPPPPPHPIDCASLAGDRFVEVSEESFRRYESALEHSPALALSPEDLPSLLPVGFRSPTQGRPYLLRALFLNRDTGAFSVCVTDTGVLVTHGSLGAHPVPMTRSAVLAFLDRAPGTVFVSVSMAK